MKTSLFVPVLCLVLSLLGCNGGPRIVDNQYQTLGFPHYTVKDTFHYMGSPQLEDDSRCVGNDCNVFSSLNGKVTGDLFVLTSDGILQEFVVIQRQQAPSRYYWIALKGETFRFADKDYVERIFTINDKAAGGGYTTFLESAGIGFDGHSMNARALVRNVSDANRIYISYGCSDGLVPEDVRNDPEAKKAFMRKRFAEAVYIPGDK